MSEKPIKLLIIEDSPLLLDIIGSVFVDLVAEGQVEVLKADNGEIGLQQILEHQPEIIIFDLHMPTMDGLEMLRRFNETPLRQSGYQPHLTALTSQTQFEYIEQALTLGVDEYYTKPFNPQALLEKVKSLL